MAVKKFNGDHHLLAAAVKTWLRSRFACSHISSFDLLQYRREEQERSGNSYIYVMSQHGYITS